METPRCRGKVLLYLPRHVPPEHENSVVLAVPPLPHLALGGPLRQAGYDVRIIDAKWEPHSREEILATLGDAVCLGISALTGYAISDGLEVAGLAKARARAASNLGRVAPVFCRPAGGR